MTSAVSEKGQITIPKKLRDSLGLRPGTRLQFEERDGELIARRLAVRDNLSEVIGILPQRSTDECMRELRGPGWDPSLDPESLEPDAPRLRPRKEIRARPAPLVRGRSRR